MARSRPGGRRARAGSSPVSASASPAVATSADPSADQPSLAPSLASATLPRVWQGVGYRPLPDPAAVKALFDFAAMPFPASAVALCWAASRSDEERLVGGLVGERAGSAMFLHGPVVVTTNDPLEIAAQLVAAVLDHARALAVGTLYVRPSALDRVWVRFGFIPVPESALPAEFLGRPGRGLYAWRGGSALWAFRDSGRD